ncbi:MAG TPA: hypothetical protein VEG37_04690 [Burkholderiales bacterium]|nr:hypothetical protein [Burkholderiales bacterium]
MRPLAAIEAELDALALAPEQLLAVSEEILENWITARGQVPTTAVSEGFRLLALQRQGARGVPSFNACRESCREIAYHFNLLRTQPAHGEAAKRRRMMALLVKHLVLFVRGKLEVEGLGEFCCSSRPLRVESSVEKRTEGPYDG